MVACCFDIDGVVDLLRRNVFRDIILQFAEDYLSQSVDVYFALQAALPDRHFFIVANSSWDKAIDDVASMHVKGDLIIFFGCLLDVSCSTPVLVVPPALPMDVQLCADAIKACASGVNIVVLADLKFHWAALRVAWLLSSAGLQATAAALPIEADIHCWNPIAVLKSSSPEEKVRRVGGLVVQPERLQGAELVFIGERGTQHDQLALRFAHHTLLHYSPCTQCVGVARGADSLELRERFGGIVRVKAARTVGIILSTMGLQLDLLQRCLARAQALLSASDKRYYSFILGRINEAKLCNFPEVDLFCLISTEDTCNIRAKTFHVPVVTLYELEVGLGARDWDATLDCSLENVLRGNIDVCIANIRAAMDENCDDPPGEASGKEIIDLAVLASDTLTLANEGTVAVFDSTAADFFKTRTFQGLQEEADDAQGLGIHMGKMGIASSYVQLAEPSDLAKCRDIEDL